MLDVDGKLSIPLTEFDLSFARSSGPGGQNVNKVNSKAVLYWDIGKSPSIPEPVRQRFLARYHHRVAAGDIVVIQSDEYRDQRRNVDACMAKLADMLRSVLTPPKPRKPTKPTKGSVQRRITDKKRSGEKKKNRARPDY
jgi:ribosome-associated protein